MDQPLKLLENEVRTAGYIISVKTDEKGSILVTLSKTSNVTGAKFTFMGDNRNGLYKNALQHAVNRMKEYEERHVTHVEKIRRKERRAHDTSPEMQANRRHEIGN